MDLAADLVQSLAFFLRQEHLQVTAHFPDHMKKLSEIMSSVSKFFLYTLDLAMYKSHYKVICQVTYSSKYFHF